VTDRFNTRLLGKNTLNAFMTEVSLSSAVIQNIYMISESSLYLLNAGRRITVRQSTNDDTTASVTVCNTGK